MNFVIHDAAEATVEGINFFGAISEMFNFTGLSRSSGKERETNHGLLDCRR